LKQLSDKKVLSLHLLLCYIKLILNLLNSRYAWKLCLTCSNLLPGTLWIPIPFCCIEGLLISCNPSPMLFALIEVVVIVLPTLRIGLFYLSLLSDTVSITLIIVELVGIELYWFLLCLSKMHELLKYCKMNILNLLRNTYLHNQEEYFSEASLFLEYSQLFGNL